MLEYRTTEKLELPDVTLVMLETQEHELARLAVQECLDKAHFGDVLIFSNKHEPFRGLGHFVEVENWPSKLGWSRASWYEPPKYLRTAYALYIQWDAWIWDVSKWRADYLNYDIVGSPWWYEDGRNVGNLGFAIRSTRLMRYLRAHQLQFPCSTHSDDDLLCRGYRPALEEIGFDWAPEHVARDFAFECVRPAPDSRHFGFHAAFNFNEVLDADALRHRAELMMRSPYIRRTSHIWQSFAQKNPGLVQELENADKVHNEIRAVSIE